MPPSLLEKCFCMWAMTSGVFWIVLGAWSWGVWPALSVRNVIGILFSTINWSIKRDISAVLPSLVALL